MPSSVSGVPSRARIALPIAPEDERCPYMPIEAPWPEMVGRRSASTRRGSAAQQSRLDQDELRRAARAHLENPREEPGFWTGWWRSRPRNRSAARRRPRFSASTLMCFGPCLIRWDLRGGSPSLSWNWANARCLESPVSLRQKTVGLSHGLRPAFSRLSPGAMLIPAIVDYGFSRGYTEFDFLNGEEPYKMRWTTGYHHTYCLQIWNRRWISRLRASVFLALRPGPPVSDPWRPQPRSRTEP